MKCVVPGANVKILARAIHALAKIGEEMYVQPRHKSLSFRSVNMANSAYADFTFDDTYFSYYAFGNLDEEDSLKCKISIRSAMTVFKMPNTMDKQVETCHVKLEPDASVLRITLKYKNSIKKTHLLPILDCEKLQAAYTKEGASNHLASQSRVLLEAVQNFQPNLIEITMQVSSNKVLLRNYIEDASTIANKTRTQLALGSGEFDRYEVNVETVITFCMKELRAILHFAEATGLPITMHFESAGKPIVFVLRNSCFEANLVLSTLTPDIECQSDAATISAKRGKPLRKRSSVGRKATRHSTDKSFGCLDSDIDDKKSRRRRILVGTASKTKDLRSTEDHRQHREPTEATENGFPNRRGDDDTSRVASQRESRNENEDNYFVAEEKDCKNHEATDGDVISPLRRMSNKIPDNSNSSSSSKKVVQSVFSNVIKRKSTDIYDTERQEEDAENVETNDTIPNSPPRLVKRAKIIFKKCFQSTFDPRMLPGHDTILVEDSDENSD